MNLALDRGLSLLELLARHPDGLPLAMMAEELDIPLSACHRLLADLQQRGYVRQKRKQGDYQLTTKVVSIGLGYLSHSGMVDIAGPLLERLAQQSGELVRLSLVDVDRLTFVAKAQGARSGLRYDPDAGTDVRLSCSSAGHAWLSTLPEDQALQIVARQGFGKPEDYGPNAPTTVKALVDILHATRQRGYATINEMFAPGMTAMAAPVQREGEPAIGVITIAGPKVRLTEARMAELAPELLAVASELALASGASPMFRRQRSAA